MKLSTHLLSNSQKLQLQGPTSGEIMVKLFGENIKNQFIFENLPIRIFTLIENLNIKFLKQKFSEQSKIDIGIYKVDLNSKEIKFTNKSVKLTEKEMNIITFLSKSKTPIKIRLTKKYMEIFFRFRNTYSRNSYLQIEKKNIRSFGDNNFIKSQICKQIKK